MSIPFNGWANSVAIQAETTFNASSAATVYKLIGKTRLTQAQQFYGKTIRTDIWRTAATNAANASSYNGTIEIELGFNAVTQLLLASFFELYATTSLGGGLTQYSFRPHRALGVSSFKIGLSYSPGGPYWVYSGVVIDSIALSIMRSQTPKLTIQYKAAQFTNAGGVDPLGSPTTVTKYLANHAQCSMTLNAAALTNLFEANFSLVEIKSLAQFSSSGIATRPGRESGFSFGGQIAEYFHSASPLPAALRDQVERAFAFTITDPGATGRLLTINWPRVALKDSLPDGISEKDLSYRVNFAGLQDTSLNDSSQANLIFVA